MIFSCQINKRGRLAPASALRSSTSAAAAAALSRPGWKPPARPGPRTSQFTGWGATKPPPRPRTSDRTPPTTSQSALTRPSGAIHLCHRCSAPHPHGEHGAPLSQPSREVHPKSALVKLGLWAPQVHPASAQRCREKGSNRGGWEDKEEAGVSAEKPRPQRGKGQHRHGGAGIRPSYSQ